MKEPIRFRNHISIVAEQAWKQLIFLFFLLVGGFAKSLSQLLSAVSEMTDRSWLAAVMTGAGILLILLLFAGWQILVWSKTYISIQDNALVIERNTLNRKKHTIGISNISNVNTEQNLFEMLMGTCKLKLDTNSLSTANKTDVMIVLKKEEAEEFRSFLLALLRGEDGEPLSAASPDLPPSDVIHAQAGDIIRHGIFSINLFSILVLAGCIVGAVTGISELMENGLSGRGIGSILISMFLIIAMSASALWDIVKGFIRYYDFCAFRRNDKLYIHYGILKKVSYTIPVDKIHALKLSQSLPARLTGRYMAEIVNVGMGDDDSEKNSFLILYCKEPQLKQSLNLLLPEYAKDLTLTFPRQPRKVWLAWICPLLVYLGSLLAAAAAVLLWLEDYRIFLPAGLAVGLMLAPLTLLLRYLTAGMELHPDFLLTASGYCHRSILMVSYRKIQFIELRQNPLAKAAGIQKGSIHLLASALNQTHGLPYCPETDSGRIRERLLQSVEMSGYTDISK